MYFLIENYGPEIVRQFSIKKEIKVSYIAENQEVNIPEVEEKQIDDEIFIKRALQSNPK